MSAVNLWVVRTSFGSQERECGSLAPLIARRVRHRLGPLRGVANMIPYTVCSSSSPTQRDSESRTSFGESDRDSLSGRQQCRQRSRHTRASCLASWPCWGWARSDFRVHLTTERQLRWFVATRGAAKHEYRRMQELEIRGLISQNHTNNKRYS